MTSYIPPNQELMDVADSAYSNVDSDTTAQSAAYSKVDVVASSKARKQENLIRRAGLADTDLSEDTYTNVNGYEVGLSNKIVNDYTLEELDAIEDAAYAKYGVFDTDQGLMQANEDGTLQKFAGDVQTLGSYYKMKTVEGHDKYGIWGGLNARDRISDGYKKRTGQGGHAPLGVDPSQEIDNKIMPYAVARILEGLRHGSKHSLENRVAIRKEGESFDLLNTFKDVYGSGYTEMYKSQDDTTPAGNAPLDRGKLFAEVNDKYRLDTGGMLTRDERIDMYHRRMQDAQRAPEADALDRAGNMAKGFASTVAREVVVNTVDVVAEIFGGEGVGTEEEKKKFTDNFFGYDSTYTQEAMAKIGGNVENIYNAVKNDEDIDLGDVKAVFSEAWHTPEILSDSLASMVGLFIGLGKFTKVGGAVLNVEKRMRAGEISKAAAKAEVKDIKKAASRLEKAQAFGASNLGMAAVVAGRSNDTVDAFMAHNDGEADWTDITSIVLVETAVASLDKFSGAFALRDVPGMTMFKNPKAVDALKEAVDVAENPVLKAGILKAASRGLKEVSKIGGTAGIEATTEYLQTLGEVFNEKYGSVDYGSDLYNLLMSDESQIEAFTGMAVGFVMGGQMEGMSSVSRMAGDTYSGIKEKLGTSERVMPVDDTTKSDEELTATALDVYKEASDTFKGIFEKMEQGGFTSEDFSTVSNVMAQVKDASEYAVGVEGVEVAEHRAVIKKMRKVANDFVTASNDGNVSVTPAAELTDTNLETPEIESGNITAVDVATNTISDIIEDNDGTLTPELSEKLGNFAVANNLPREVVEKLVKSYATVRQEATVESRGTVDRRNKLKATLASGTATSKEVQSQYDEAVSFYSSTVAAEQALKQGIKKARARAVTENNSLALKKEGDTISVVTEYLTHPESTKKGEPFDITLTRRNGEWKPNLTEAYNRLKEKTSRVKELSSLLEEFHEGAQHFLDPDRTLSTGGYVVTKTSGTAQRAVVAESEFVSSVKDVLKKPVNKVIVGEDPGTQWLPTTTRSRINSAVTNSLSGRGVPYKSSDVVYLHAPGVSSPSKGFKVVELNTKNSKTAKELDAAMEAGATIVLANDHRVVSGKNIPGGSNHGGALAKYLEGKGYIPMGVADTEKDIFVPDTEASSLNLARKREEAAVLAADKKSEAKAKNRLTSLSIKAAAQELRGEAVSEELKADIEAATAAVVPYFTSTALRQTIKSIVESQEGDTGNKEITDATNPDDVEFIATELAEGVDLNSLKEANETYSLEDLGMSPVTRDALVAAKVSENVEENIASFRTNSVNKAVSNAKDSRRKAQKEGTTIEFSKDLTLLAESSEAADVKAASQGTGFLAAWKDAAKRKLEGVSLVAELRKAGKALGVIVDRANGDNTAGKDVRSKAIGNSILADSVGSLNKDATYYVTVSTFDSKGVPIVVYKTLFTNGYKIKDPETGELVFHKYKVGDRYFRGEKAKDSEILAVNKVISDPSKYIEVKRPTPFNTLASSMMPKVFQDLTKNTMDALKSVLPPLHEHEKGIRKSQKGEDLSKSFMTLDSPARALIYDKDGKINANMALSIGVAIRSILSNDKKKLLKGPKDLKTVAAMFGVTEDNVKQEMVKYASEHGTYAKTIQDALGKEILSALGMGIKAANGFNRNQYERLVIDLGNIAMAAAEKDGLLVTEGVQSNALSKMIRNGEEWRGEKAEAETLFVTMGQSKKKIKGSKYSAYAPDTKTEEAIGVFEEINEYTPDPTSRKKGPFFGTPPSEQYQRNALNGIRNDRVGGHVPADAKKALKSYMNTPFKMNTVEVDKFLAKLDDPKTEKQVKALLGFIDIDPEDPKYAGMLLDQKEIQVSTNKSIEDSIKALREARESIRSGELDNKMYFGFYYSGNHRYNLDSNTLNPQTDKLHRFFIQPEAHEVTYEVDRSNNTFIYKYENGGKPSEIDSSLFIRAALAQAVGIGIDKTYTEDIIDVGNYLLALNSEDVDVIEERYLREGKISLFTRGEHVDIEPDHPSHALQALQFLRDFAKDKSTTFTSSLSAEFDALTSGFSNKVQQYGTLDDLTAHANRVGIIRKVTGNDDARDAVSSTTGVNDMLADSKRLDSYKNLADRVIRLVSVKLGDSFGNENTKYFNAIKDILPGGDLIGMTEFAVDGALRNLFKPAFMIFNYSASINRIVKNLGEEMVEKALATIAKTDLTAPENAKVAVAAAAIAAKVGNDVTPAQLQEMLRTKSTSKIMIKALRGNDDGTTSKTAVYVPIVESISSTLIEPTYGKSVEEAFKVEFSDFIEIQDATNDMFKQAYTVFNQALLNKVKEHRKAGNQEITEEVFKGFIESLRDAFPVIAGPLSSMVDGARSLNDGVHIYDTSITSPNTVLNTAPSPQARLKNLDGKESRTANPLIRSMIAAANSGAVLPFHALDGAQMATTTNRFVEEWLRGSSVKGSEQHQEADIGTVGAGILPVHDAIIPPLPFSDAVSYIYNQSTVSINKQYSIMVELVKMAERSKDYVTNESNPDYVNPKTLTSPEGLKILTTSENKPKTKAYKKAIKEAATDLKKLKSDVGRADFIAKGNTPGEYGAALSAAETLLAQREAPLGFLPTFSLSLVRLKVLAAKVAESREEVLTDGAKVGVLVGLPGSVYTVGDPSNEPSQEYLKTYAEEGLYTADRKHGPKAPTYADSEADPARTTVNDLNQTDPIRSAVANKVLISDTSADSKSPHSVLVNSNKDAGEPVDGDLVMVVYDELDNVIPPAMGPSLTAMKAGTKAALKAGASVLFSTVKEMEEGVSGLSKILPTVMAASEGLYLKTTKEIQGEEYVILKPIHKENATPANTGSKIKSAEGAYADRAAHSAAVIGQQVGEPGGDLNSIVRDNPFVGDLGSGDKAMLVFPEGEKNDTILSGITTTIAQVSAVLTSGASVLFDERRIMDDPATLQGSLLGAFLSKVGGKDNVIKEDYVINGKTYLLATLKPVEVSDSAKDLGDASVDPLQQELELTKGDTDFENVLDSAENVIEGGCQD